MVEEMEKIQNNDCKNLEPNLFVLNVMRKNIESTRPTLIRNQSRVQILDLPILPSFPVCTRNSLGLSLTAVYVNIKQSSYCR